MIVSVDNLPAGTTAETVKREFQRVGSCKVDLHDCRATVEYLDIVYASEAIKLFNGKDFGGNRIIVKKETNYVINLSQKRERSPSRQILSLSAPTSKIITLGGTKAVIPTGKVYLGGRAHDPEEIKLSRQEAPVDISKKTDASANLRPELPSNKSVAEVKDDGILQPVKVQKIEKIERKEEVKEKTKEIVEDNLMIEIEGSKFLKTTDDLKLHCIVCDKEITKKSLKTHVSSKAHKALI